MRYYHIYPSVPSVITVGGVGCADFVNIECDDSDSFAVTVNPLDCSGGFAFVVDAALSLPKNIKVVRLPQGHFDLLVSPLGRGEAVRTSVLFCGNRHTACLYDSGELWLGELRLSLPPKSYSLAFDTVEIVGKRFLEVTCSGYLGLVDENYNIAGEIYAESISRRGAQIEAVRYFKDIAGRAEVSRYEVRGGARCRLTLKESFNVYLEGTPKRPESKRLYPLAFLQAVLAKDYDEARFYLSSELNESLSNSDLSDFFPHSDIYPCSYYPDNCIVLLGEDGQGSLYKITYNENSIDNIEEV